MKKITIAFFSLFSYFGNAQVGIATTAPANTLDVNGWVKIADQTSTNGSAVAGSIRYNSIKQCLELYNGTTWACIGQPKMQTHIVRDGVDSTLDATGVTNYTNVSPGGYGAIRNFTVNNVPPSSRVLFLVEIGLNTNAIVNPSFNNMFKIYGNGVFEEYEIPATGSRDVVSFFAWGSPNNVTMANLGFRFECNHEYNNVKITTLVF